MAPLGGQAHPVRESPGARRSQRGRAAPLTGSARGRKASTKPQPADARTAGPMSRATRIGRRRPAPGPTVAPAAAAAQSTRYRAATARSAPWLSAPGERSVRPSGWPAMLGGASTRPAARSAPCRAAPAGRSGVARGRPGPSSGPGSRRASAASRRRRSRRPPSRSGPRRGRRRSSSQTRNCGDSTLPATRSATIVAAEAATNRRASPGARARRRPIQRLQAIPQSRATSTAVEMPAITAGPVPSRPWLPNEFSTVIGMSARAWRPSR